MEHGAFILARYSTDRQNPDSIEVQVEKCSEWCRQHALPVLGVYADYATSGMKDNRPQQMRMMEDLRAGQADTVVIYDQSRMFRKLTAWFAFRDELEGLGASVVSVTQPNIGGDLRDPTNFLTEGSMALFNQIWALQTRQKVMAKMQYMARQGLHTGGTPPLGYHVVDGRLAVQEQEAATVRRIFREYADGHSYRQIIAGLNQDGITTKRGSAWGTNSMHDLLKNDKYIGTLSYGKTPRTASGHRNSHGTAADVIRIEDAIPAIIDRATFDKVQGKLKLNVQKHSGRPPRRDYPLKGKVFCGDCGSAMSINISKRIYYYYRCNAKDRKGQCQGNVIRVDTLEDLVASTIRNTLGNPGNVESLISILRHQRDSLRGSAALELNALLQKRTEIAKQLDAATDAVLHGLVSQSLTAKIHLLEADRSRNEAQIRTLRKNMEASSVPEAQLQTMLQRIIETAEYDNGILLSIVSRVEVTADCVKIWTIMDTDPDELPHPQMESDAGRDDVIITIGDGSPAPIESFNTQFAYWALLFYCLGAYIGN